MKTLFSFFYCYCYCCCGGFVFCSSTTAPITVPGLPNSLQRKKKASVRMFKSRPRCCHTKDRRSAKEEAKNSQPNDTMMFHMCVCACARCMVHYVRFFFANFIYWNVFAQIFHTCEDWCRASLELLCRFKKNDAHKYGPGRQHEEGEVDVKLLCR